MNLLSRRMLQSVKSKTGYSAEEIQQLDYEEIERTIQKNGKKRIVFPQNNSPLGSVRGSVLLTEGRFLNNKKRDRILSKIK